MQVYDNGAARVLQDIIKKYSQRFQKFRPIILVLEKEKYFIVHSLILHDKELQRAIQSANVQYVFEIMSSVRASAFVMQLREYSILDYTVASDAVISVIIDSKDYFRIALAEDSIYQCGGQGQNYEFVK